MIYDANTVIDLDTGKTVRYCERHRRYFETVYDLCPACVDEAIEEFNQNDFAMFGLWQKN